MHKVIRFTALAILAASGLTACGDKVTNITPPPTTSTTTSTPQVTAVTVTPNAVQLNVGQSVQLVATVTADAGAARTVTWSSSAASVASVDATGKVTANAAGTAVIIATSTANAGVQGTSAITVAGTTNPTITISTVTDSTGAPALLNNIAGQINVTLNVDPGSTFIKEIDLLMNCGAGDVLVASQIVSAKAPMTGPAGATQPVTLPFNTAALDSTGVPKFKNGSCTLKAKLTTTTGGIFNSTNTTPITLNNTSRYTATITTANSNGGSFPASAISPKTGLLRNQGAVTLTITAVNYSSAAPVKTINGSFMGRLFAASAATGTQQFVVTFPVDSTKTDPALGAGGTNSAAGIGSCAQGGNNSCLGVYQYASGDQGEVAPAITSSIDTLGQNAFTGSAAVATAFRLDNSSPSVPSSDTVKTGLNYYVNGSYTFFGTKLYKSAGDVQEGPTTVQIGYMASSNFANAVQLPIVAGTTHSGYGATACTTTGWTLVSSISDIPTSTTNSAYVARAFEYDVLGNVRCTDLLVYNNVGTVAAAFGVDRSPPTIAFSTANSGVTANKKIQLAPPSGWNFTFAYSDTGSGFNPSWPVMAKVTFNYGSDSAHCSVGWTNGTGCLQIPMPGSFAVDRVKPDTITPSTTAFVAAEGYYTVTAHTVDQAGNASPDSTRTVLEDATAPVATSAIAQSPSTIASMGTATFTVTATDNVDLGSWSNVLQYAPGSGTVNFAEPGGTFNAGFNGTLVQSGTASSSVANIWKGMQGTAAGLIAADATAPKDSMNLKDVAGNPTSVALAAVGFNTGVVTANILQNCADNQAAGACGFALGANTTIGVTSSPNPTSTTLVAKVTGRTTGVPNQPFATVYFYYKNSAGALVQIGSQTLASVTDDGAGNRTWTFTGPAVNAATFGLSSSSAASTNEFVYAVGVDAAGNAVVTNANPQQITVTNP